MGKLDIDINEVKKLVELVETYNLEELVVEQSDLSITVKGHAATVSTPLPVVVQTSNQAAIVEPAQTIIEETDVEPAEEIEGNIVDIVAPLVGVFYRASAPDVPSLVEVGDVISVGTEIGLIEAMKVFSPIQSEVAGEIVAIPAANGNLVREGEVLVRVRIAGE